MADVADDTKAIANEQSEQEQSEATSNGEKTTDTAPPAESSEAVKTNGEAVTDETAAKIDDRTAEKQEDADEKESADKSEGSASKSPDHKRKQPPVSVSAHERHERKRNRGGYRYNTKNIKTRFEDQPESSDPEEIRRQVEFYFSDSNLPIDAYLLEQTGGHENLPVELKVIHNFKRMRHFQPFSAVRDAVAASDYLILSENDEITRKVPLDKKFTDDPVKNRTLVHSSSMPRSIYAKGFGDEKESTQFDIEGFFEPYGPVLGVRMRRAEDGLFKGSVFVEFADENTQQTFLELDPKPEFDGKELEIMSKQEYVDMKHEGILDGTVKPKSAGAGNFRGGDRKPFRGGRGGDRRYSGGYDDRRRSGDGDKRRGRDNIDEDDWKTRRDRDQDEDRRDRHGGRGRGRGRGRGGRGDRGGRGGRRRSPDYGDRKRRRSDADEERDERGDRDDVPSRAEAEAKKVKGDDGAADEKKGDVGGEAVAGAGSTKANGIANAGNKVDTPAAESKKRSREDEGIEDHGEAKKVKEDLEA